MPTEQQWLQYLMALKDYEIQFKKYQKNINKWINKTFKNKEQVMADDLPIAPEFPK